MRIERLFMGRASGPDQLAKYRHAAGAYTAMMVVYMLVAHYLNLHGKLEQHHYPAYAVWTVGVFGVGFWLVGSWFLWQGYRLAAILIFLFYLIRAAASLRRAFPLEAGDDLDWAYTLLGVMALVTAYLSGRAAWNWRP